MNQDRSILILIVAILALSGFLWLKPSQKRVVTKPLQSKPVVTSVPVPQVKSTSTPEVQHSLPTAKNSFFVSPEKKKEFLATSKVF